LFRTITRLHRLSYTTPRFYQLPVRSFAKKGDADPLAMAQSSMGTPNRKVDVRTLCNITGTKYYTHNKEIEYEPEKLVKVYDENDVLIGDM